MPHVLNVGVDETADQQFTWMLVFSAVQFYIIPFTSLH